MATKVHVMGGFILAMVLLSGLADAKCTMQNKSQKDIVIVPVDVSADVSIEVQAGVTVVVPDTHRHCKLRNKDSGHEMGPFTLPDNQLLVVVDATVVGKVDIYVATLLSRILHFVVSICVSL